MKGVAWLVLAAMFCGGCRRAERIEVMTGEAMGTTYRIKCVGGFADAPDFDELLAGLDAELSTWRRDSWVSRFNRAGVGEAMEMPPSVVDLLKISQDVQRRTDGCFDPAIGALIKLWGFGAWEREWQGMPTAEQIDVAMRVSGMRFLKIDGRMLCKTREGVMLDFSGVAKGYAVDRMTRRLRKAGRQHFIIEFGGDLIGRGKPPGKPGWLVDGPALAKPMILQNEALCTSGSEHHFRDGMSHIIDPRTGWPTPVSPPTFAVAGTCAEADAYATAMHVQKLGNKPGQ